MQSILLFPMRLVFRADASREIGSGHVMRSSVLAEEAISRGIKCIFVGKISELDWVSERIANLGFLQVISDESAFVANAETDILVLDSYSIPVDNAFIAKENWKLVLSICDQITPKYVADLKLRPGLEKLDELKDEPVVLSGPDYILIRKGIEKSRRKIGASEIPKVLVVGGGSDLFGYVRAVSHVIDSLRLSFEVHVFTNDFIPTGFSMGFVIHPIGSDLDSIAGDVDVVLTTASTSSLEFIAREVPTGVVCAVDNQENYYEQLGRLGYASQIGVRNHAGDWDFNLEAIRELLTSPAKRDSLTESARGLVDLRGAARVIDALESLAPS